MNYLFYLLLVFSFFFLKVDMDLLNAVKSVLADVSSVSPSPEQRDTRTGNTSLIGKANQ